MLILRSKLIKLKQNTRKYVLIFKNKKILKNQKNVKKNKRSKMKNLS